MLIELKNHTYYKLIVYIFAAVLLSRLGVLYVFSIVPLHLLQRKYPGKIFFASSIAVLLGIILWDSIGYIRIDLESTDILIAVIGMFYPGALLIGVIFYYLPMQLRKLYRFLFAGIVPGCIGAYLVVLFEGESEAAQRVIEFYYSIFQEVLKFSGYGDIDGNSITLLFSLSVRIIKSSFLPVWYFLTGLGILVSEMICNRKSGSRVTFLHWFKVPDLLLWPFIAAWLIAFLDLIIGLGITGILVWNAALVLLMVYGTAGISIIMYLGKKKGIRLNPLSWILFSILLLLIPVINVIMLIVIPVLGISEYWIKYRIKVKENLDENHT
ncbi:MAG: hypothetical protein KAQ69_09100 [Spirochaetales bacterium]|nr:hypothetical protein [Spirochaetales bacterium]